MPRLAWDSLPFLTPQMACLRTRARAGANLEAPANVYTTDVMLMVSRVCRHAWKPLPVYNSQMLCSFTCACADADEEAGVGAAGGLLTEAEHTVSTSLLGSVSRADTCGACRRG